jgi:hypothetical protein
MVIIREEFKDRNFTVEDFKEANVVELIWVWQFSQEHLLNPNFRPILKLRTEKKGKQYVLEAIKIIEEEYDFVYCVGPEYHYESGTD